MPLTELEWVVGIGFGVEKENAVLENLTKISVRQVEMTGRQLVRPWSSGEDWSKSGVWLGAQDSAGQASRGSAVQGIGELSCPALWPRAICSCWALDI